MTVLAVIPARMGSARLPRKNLLEIEKGLSLVQQAINCARYSGAVDDVVVSTDETTLPIDGAVIRVRPENLCGPNVDIADVVHDVWGAQGARHDWIVTLQPAVLARSPLIVRNMIHAAKVMNASAITMAHTVPWHWRVDGNQADTPWMNLGAYPRSQDSPACWAEVNAVQVAPASVIANRCRWGLPLLVAALPAWAVSLDIDEPADLEMARSMWPWAKHVLETWKPSCHMVSAVKSGGWEVKA